MGLHLKYITGAVLRRGAQKSYGVDISEQFMEVPGVQYRSRAARVLRRAGKKVWLIGADR